jgi:hypothetical protein
MLRKYVRELRKILSTPKRSFAFSAFYLSRESTCKDI